MATILYRNAHKLVHKFQTKSTVLPEDKDGAPTSLDDLCQRLRRNELKELRIGYRDSDFLISKRSVNQLEKALKINTSVTHISVGWRHKHRQNRRVLLEILRAIGKYTKLRSIELILDDWVPESLLRLLLQQRTLVHIDIRAVHVKRKTALGRWCCDTLEENSHAYKNGFNNNSTEQTTALLNPLSYPAHTHCDHCLVSRVLVPMHLNAHANLKTLQLIDCGLQDKQAVMLADFLHIRGGIAELSLRSNRQLRAHGISVLIQSPVTSKLDLSLCDMSPKTASALAPAIAARPWLLDSLLLCGNYRMGADALLSLVDQKCCDKIMSMNLSYCDITASRTRDMLEALAELDSVRTKLRELSIQGANVANDDAIKAFCKLLKCNLPLRVIRMSDPGQPKCISSEQLRALADAMVPNFQMEDILVDVLFNTERIALWREMEFYLRLNRAGRRVLLDQVKKTNQIEAVVLTPPPTVSWFQVLERANDDLEVLYWIVRHSADRFRGIR